MARRSDGLGGGGGGQGKEVRNRRTSWIDRLPERRRKVDLLKKRESSVSEQDEKIRTGRFRKRSEKRKKKKTTEPRPCRPAR
jgi:hypothetical protein